MNNQKLEERRKQVKAFIGQSIYVPDAIGTYGLSNVLESVSEPPFKICTVLWSDGDRRNYYLWEVKPEPIPDAPSTLNLSRTARGFDRIEFTDRSQSKCCLQKSSLATDNAIWFGVDDAKPVIMRSQAEAYGIDVGAGPEARNGWIDFPIPKEVLLTTAMHLTQDQVRELLPYLVHFAQTGELHES